ncbi:uncharacterized protein BJX67DRAFT_370769 [Aspergillus lucknowensis]|uniref:Restriction endonuclease domain-containing protein n=1 Tax=Aspergillus lucknowensis TaxID=176173 RepID=A0ABR4LYC6_9EURO
MAGQGRSGHHRLAMETSWKETHILFSGLDQQTFKRDIENTSCRRINQSFDTYLPHAGILLLEMPASDVHETASNRLNLLIMEALPRRLCRTLSMAGKAGFQSASRLKCADQGYIPISLPPGRSRNWPSVVIECGWSESRAKLERDCRWWLHASGGDIKIALSISKLAQTIVISQTRSHPIRITGAPLCLEFDKVFLRQPTRAEHNIEIAAEDLRFLAQDIWRIHSNV